MKICNDRWRIISLVVHLSIFRALGTLVVISISPAAFMSCRPAHHRQMAPAGGVTPDVSERTDVIYAQGFRTEKVNDGLLLILNDPNDPSREIARYRLVTGDAASPEAIGCVDIQIPVRGMAVSSTTHAGFLSAIGSGGCLMGCNNPERLYDSVLFERFKKGDLIRTGRDLEFNREILIASRPDLVLQTGIDGQFTADQRLTSAGIPVMFVLEWMEKTPLGRAEWLKVFGLLTGRLRAADSLFRIIETDYLRLAGMGKGCTEKTKVLTGNVFKGTWYMPGGKNYMSRFFEDAGMDYVWSDTEQSGSLALSLESVVYRLSDAPVWINVNVDSLSALRAAEPRYQAFRAFRENRIYSLFNRVNSHGGNDFWESGVFRPDLVLADLLAIAHPELMAGHHWNYYKPIIFN